MVSDPFDDGEGNDEDALKKRRGAGAEDDQAQTGEDDLPDEDEDDDGDGRAGGKDTKGKKKKSGKKKKKGKASLKGMALDDDDEPEEGVVDKLKLMLLSPFSLFVPGKEDVQFKNTMTHKLRGGKDVGLKAKHSTVDIAAQVAQGLPQGQGDGGGQQGEGGSGAAATIGAAAVALVASAAAADGATKVEAKAPVKDDEKLRDDRPQRAQQKDEQPPPPAAEERAPPASSKPAFQQEEQTIASRAPDIPDFDLYEIPQAKGNDSVAFSQRDPSVSHQAQMEIRNDVVNPTNATAQPDQPPPSLKQAFNTASTDFSNILDNVVLRSGFSNDAGPGAASSTAPAVTQKLQTPFGGV